MALGCQSPDFYDAAVGLYQAVLEGRNTLLNGDDNTDSIATTNNMAWLLARMGRGDEAIPLFTKVFEFRSRVYGPRHSSVLNAAQNLGVALLRKGQLDEARERLLFVARGKIENMGQQHPSTQKALKFLVDCLRQRSNGVSVSEWESKIIAREQ